MEDKGEERSPSSTAEMYTGRSSGCSTRYVNFRHPTSNLYPFNAFFRFQTWHNNGTLQTLFSCCVETFCKETTAPQVSHNLDIPLIETESEQPTKILGRPLCRLFLRRLAVHYSIKPGRIR